MSFGKWWPFCLGLNVLSQNVSKNASIMFFQWAFHHTVHANTVVEIILEVCKSFQNLHDTSILILMNG